MQNGDPKPQSSGNQPPPRPPKRTAIAANPDDNGDSRKNSKMGPNSINLPPKPSSPVIINLPTFPPGGPAFQGVKLIKKTEIAASASESNQHLRRFARNVELGMVLAAVAALNGMLYVLCRL